MPVTYVLKKVVPANTLVEMELDRYWVIERIGTNISDAVTIEVDGIPVVKIHSTIAPIARTNANLFGPVSLKDLYVVVPPQRKFYARSAGSGSVYVEGKLVVLAPGEAIPTEHLARYNAYASRKLEYYSYTLNAGASLVAGREYTVASITPPAIEDHLMNRNAGVSIVNTASALTYGQVAVKLYYDGKPLDQIALDIKRHGIDVLKMPLPPTATAEFEGFSFSDLPILVSGGHTLEVKVVNVSGSDIAAASGQNITITFMAFYERTIKS
ncbi:MAG: hypothetical protein QXZ22_08145 [Sulfolobales archaeon]